VPIEAAAHKLPTLLIKDSCTAENIEDNFNGFLAEEKAHDVQARLPLEGMGNLGIHRQALPCVSVAL
jgi:hypothetical protein